VTGIVQNAKTTISLREKYVIAVILGSQLKERDRGKLRGGSVDPTLETIGILAVEVEVMEGVADQPEHSCI
tara:strand:- start:6133 stop:6345 length:213 start_codon:yes stop_codon:yes gene_type:complete